MDSADIKTHLILAVILNPHLIWGHSLYLAVQYDVNPTEVFRSDFLNAP